MYVVTHVMVGIVFSAIFLKVKRMQQLAEEVYDLRLKNMTVTTGRLACSQVSLYALCYAATTARS